MQRLEALAPQSNDTPETEVSIFDGTFLKAGTRQRRGTDISLRVAGNTSVPRNWSSFLRVDSNKITLFTFLASALETVAVPEGNILLTTNEEDDRSNPPSDVSQLQPCTHEKADSHVTPCLACLSAMIVIHSTDTDEPYMQWQWQV